MRLLFSIITCLALMIGTATADERILFYDVAIQVEPSGDLLIEEKIVVNVEGIDIRRGIFRDLPVRSSDNKKTDYKVIDVLRNGAPENYQTERISNAFRIRIGRADTMLEHRVQEYHITYRAPKQVRFSRKRDEVYWNITGTYWDFPIDQIRARITLPEGARIQDASVYTGRRGETGHDAQYTAEQNTHVFQSTKPQPPQAGMTISLSFDEGLVQRPTLSERMMMRFIWALPLLFLSAGAAGIWLFLHKTYLRVGVDPEKYPVTVEFEPPKDISPAAAAFIVNRSKVTDTMLLAALLQLGIGKIIQLNVKDEKNAIITPGEQSARTLKSGSAEDILISKLFAKNNKITLDGSHHKDFTKASSAFHAKIKRRYGRYFKWNEGYLVSAIVLGIILSVLSVIILSIVGASPTLVKGFIIVGLGLLITLAIYAYLLPAPTKKGYRIRNHLLGFKEYLNTAEAQYLNMAEPELKAPPVMSSALYERFLPYAVALGVEKPWSEYFETVMPKEAEAMKAHWSDTIDSSSIGTTHSAITALSSSVASARVSPASSSSSSGSSGFGGGGSSGGGGGGGGGGGW